MGNLPVRVFIHSGDSFIRALQAAGIPHTKRIQLAQESAWWIDVASATAPWAALASVLVAWVQQRAKRHVRITYADGSSADITNYSSAEIARIVSNAKQIEVTEPEDRHSDQRNPSAPG